MQRKNPIEVVLILILLLLGVAYYSYDNFVYRSKVQQIKRLDKQIEKENERLIAAQILDQELSAVARLLQENLATSVNDDLVQGSAVSFLKFLTQTLNAIDIELLSIQPKMTKRSKNGDFLETTYNVQIYCNYKKFGQLVNRIEKSDRIIWVRYYEVRSNIDYLLGKDHSRGIDNRVIEMELSTITLLKNEI